MTQTTSEAPMQGRKMTFEEFLEWADEDTRAEWVNGEVMVMSPASDMHQMLVGFLYKLMDEFAKARDLGVVLPAPFVMKINHDTSGREPDILFIARENLSRLKTTFLDGPADLVVEIISPDSRARDRGVKYYEYEQGGIREYWLIDPTRKQAEFYRRGEDGYYHFITAGEDGIYQSAAMEGFRLRVNWLWQEPLPTLLAVLKEWSLV